MNQKTTPRHLAVEVLNRIENDGAFANLALSAALDRSGFDKRDRAFVTDMVYGTTRMQRACDHLLNRFLHDEIEPSVRTVLRLGVWQVAFGGVPAHAAVSETVTVAPRRVRGLCNAVLRRVSDNPVTEWPSSAIELSYPDWLVDRLEQDLGLASAHAMMATMNQPALAVVRQDGYHQDHSSQMVAACVAQGLTEQAKVLDLCAAPGGKATGIATEGPWVVAADVRPKRLNLVADNAQRLELPLGLVAADGLHPQFRQNTFDRVLVDAPCSGLGVLRRRADARWRVTQEEIDRLADLQVALLTAAWPLVRPGGQLVYSVCTVTTAETIDVDERFRQASGAQSAEPLPKPWRPHGTGGIMLPQDADSEGMALFRYQKTD